jgi:peptidase C39-like protein
MPLRVPQGRPINVPPPTFGAKTLNVPWIKQEQKNWCWAGCHHMAFRYYGNLTIRQCDMASYLFGVPNNGCCSAPSSTLCDKGANANQIVQVYNAFGLRCTASAGTIFFGAVQLEIDMGNPVECGIKWNGPGGHAILIIGWYDQQKVYVNDPWYGHGQVSYNDVVTGYGNGNWIVSFTGIRR